MKNNITNKEIDFNEVVVLIQSSKEQAFSQVNTTLMSLYWNIGKYLNHKTTKENWGKSIVAELSNFIKQKEPNLKGFTTRNLWRMKQFYEIYKDNKKVSSLLTQITWTNNLLIISASKSDEEKVF